MSRREVHRFVEQIVGDHLHAKRVLSLGDSVLGCLHSASLGISAIGMGLAVARGLYPKHATKQVDRLLSNKKLNDDALRSLWVAQMVGEREEIFVALDWTEFDPDGHSTIAAYLVTRHGRATPLHWRTVDKAGLKDHRNHYEDVLLRELSEWMPESVGRVTIVADRGFGDHKLYDYIEQTLGWDYIIRFRERIHVRTPDGEQRPAGQWVPASGRARKLEDVEVTGRHIPIPAVVVAKQKRMKEAWCLATSRTDLTAAQVVKLYGRRFTIEETFRDQKDDHFGMGLYQVRVRSAQRRDRLLFIAALSQVLLTLLGAACEATGLDRMLRVNTSRRRTHSLYRQGRMAYELLPGLPEEDLIPLMEAFAAELESLEVTREIFATI